MDYGGNGLGAPSKRGRTAVGATGIGLPYGGLLSRSCGGLQPLAATKGPFGPEILSEERTNIRTTALKDLDRYIWSRT